MVKYLKEKDLHEEGWVAKEVGYRILGLTEHRLEAPDRKASNDKEV